MPIQIRRRASEPTAIDAAEMLMECHGRIRDFIRTALLLTEAKDRPAHEIAAAAAGVHRYFAEALPLHAADEDRSIAPRLTALLPGAEVVDALRTMTREHEEHQAPLARLIPRWHALATDPASITRGDTAWHEDTRAFEQAIAAHLALEEAVVIPAMRRLFDPTTDAAIVAELRARRA